MVADLHAHSCLLLSLDKVGSYFHYPQSGFTLPGHNSVHARLVLSLDEVHRL